MDVRIKKTIRAGNSSAVVLPKSWLNKEVRIELVKKNPDKILLEVLDIIKEKLELEEVIGIYLIGSYARNEESSLSDIDVLVVTEKTSKIVSEGIYSIVTISSDSLKKKLKEDLLPLGQMILESKALLNKSYLDDLEIKVTKKNVKWHMDTTKEKISLIKKVLSKLNSRDDKNVDNRIVYTLVLRLRTLHIIKKIKNIEDYSNKEFARIIKKVSRGENAYESYLSVKNNVEIKGETSIEEVLRLYECLEKEFKLVKRLIK